jgi:hypothetical protein
MIAPLASVTVPPIEPVAFWADAGIYEMSRAAISRPAKKMTPLAGFFSPTWGSCGVENLYMDPLTPSW